LRHLRTIRAGIALAVLAAATLALVDPSRLLPAWAATLVARLQLVPAIVGLSGNGALVAVAVTAVVTLLLGRVYCSTVCPLGTLQDVLIRLGDRRHRRGRYRFRALPSRTGLHLLAAGTAAALAAAGSLWAIALLEPWSAFGRMISALLRPAAATAVNGAARGLAALHVYAVQPVVVPPVTWGALGVSLASLAGLVALALARGRRFCNLLCPAGALLRLLARRPAVRLAIIEERCNGCGICEKGCKAGCIDAARRALDPAACIACFDCLDMCPRDGVRLEAGWRPRAPAPATCPAEPDLGRRALLRVATLAPAALVSPPPTGGAPADPRDARAPMTPPGSGDQRRFTSRCTACHLCVSACPTQVLRPALLDYGFAGVLQPRLVYESGACAYDCTRCGQVCPTGAIVALPVTAKHLVQVGRAQFVKSDCIVETRKKACGACAEHCPTKAISMVPVEGQPPLRLPHVNEEACIGCGSCEHPCPVMPRKAIWVEARSPHGTARPIEERPLESPAASGGFPF
jgi:ferredoxin